MDAVTVSNTAERRVLIVEDDPDAAESISDILELDDYSCETASTIKESLQRLERREYGTIILDRKLPDGQAIDFLPKIRQLAPTTAVVVVTGLADLDGAVRALRLGASDYILKPINADALRATLERTTDKRKAARALEESERRFHAIFENSLDGLLVVDNDSRIVDANPAASEKLGQANDGLIGRLLDDVLCCRDQQGRHLPWRSLIKLGQAIGECQATHNQGHILDIEYRARANFLPDLHVVSIHDVTERKRAERRALQAERLAAIGETMTALVHESRNALQRSRACLEMLSMEVEQQPEATDLVNRALKAQDRLQQLYEEVRQYAAPINLERHSADVTKVWRTAWNNVIEAHPEKKLELQEQLEIPEVRCPVDRARLEQVFVNIFENAQQVSPAGSRIDVKCIPTTIEDQPAVQISIRDEGPGMSREQRERIFEAFFTTKTKGTGLGMAIVQRIMHAHGGRIAVADRDGPGAEIILTLPRASA